MNSLRDYMKYEISVVVPVYNEGKNLEKAVVSLVDLLKKECKDYEIIIVDSDSKDNTKEIADALCRKYKKVRAIFQKERKGFGNGLREGYKNCKLDFVWYVDADLPYDLSELKKAFPFMKDYDAVIGYKTGKRENLMRVLMSIIYNNLIRLVFGLKFRDINYSYKIIRNDVLKNLSLKSDGWFVATEILVELDKKGYKVKELHVPFKMRVEGESKVSNYLGVTFYFLKEVFRYKKEQICGQHRDSR